MSGKNLSNPSSTGGIGTHFEEKVQASFVTLLLTGGFAPCLPPWPISKIKLQGKVDGFGTDDFIVTVRNPGSREERSILAQVKRSVPITKSSEKFQEVIQAAWDDFNNPRIFQRGKDVIGLITSAMTKTDSEVRSLLSDARSNPHDPHRFFENIKKANFGSRNKIDKLDVFREHLTAANSGRVPSNREVHEFLCHFYLLCYDLDEQEGVVLSLIQSHISQFQPNSAGDVWNRIWVFTSHRNQHAGHITWESLDESLKDIFGESSIERIPEYLSNPHQSSLNWLQKSDNTVFSLLALIGSWDDKSEKDRDFISDLFKISYSTWEQKGRELLNIRDGSLSLNNGVWLIANRTHILERLGSYIIDADLDIFKSLAIKVLREIDPALELPREQRFASSIFRKSAKYSKNLRRGIAEALAIMGSHPKSFGSSRTGKVERVCREVIRKVFSDADWRMWASLYELLPTLAEASPDQFLQVVDKTLHPENRSFDRLFAEEGGDTTSPYYMVGLMWALETLAWDSKYLMQAALALANLSNRDPGGIWANRPQDSLRTILLPWLPQTLASVKKRKATISKIFDDYPDIGWRLIIQLLPSQHQVSSRSHKPKWRQTIPAGWKNEVKTGEYWEQVNFCSDLAVSKAGNELDKILTLISVCGDLPDTSFSQLVVNLNNIPLSNLSEDEIFAIWRKTTDQIANHRRFSDAKWVMPDERIAELEQVANCLAPSDPMHEYRDLFDNGDFRFRKQGEPWTDLSARLDTMRGEAVLSIFQRGDFESVLEFSQTVSFADRVGYHLGRIAGDSVTGKILPAYLTIKDVKQSNFVRGFIWGKHQLEGWDWSDRIDVSAWTAEEIGEFLACHPFTQETWKRVQASIGGEEGEYWSKAKAYLNIEEEQRFTAISKLIDHNRPFAAIRCLSHLLNSKQAVGIALCIQALSAATSSSEVREELDDHSIVKIFEFLQSQSDTSRDELIRLEWSYFPLLERYGDSKIGNFVSELSQDPTFFWEFFQMVYGSKHEAGTSQKSSEVVKERAVNAYRVLEAWQTPPGLRKNGTFDAQHFEEWLNHVRELCSGSDYLDIVLSQVGKVLVHTPPDPTGLWIHKAVARALNERDSESMRSGFHTGIFNLRGAYLMEDMGETEKELAREYYEKAEEVENSGFQRLAVTLRELSEYYEQEAERIISEHD